MDKDGGGGGGGIFSNSLMLGVIWRPLENFPCMRDS